MSVNVLLPNGEWETIEDAKEVRLDASGALQCLGLEPGFVQPSRTVAIYAPGSWVYGEVAE